MTLKLCDPKTWPCYPLLSVKRKIGGQRGTLIHRSGQPRDVIFEPCGVVRAALDGGNTLESIMSSYNGSSEMTCQDVEISWVVDEVQEDCCGEGR